MISKKIALKLRLLTLSDTGIKSIFQTNIPTVALLEKCLLFLVCVILSNLITDRVIFLVSKSWELNFLTPNQN